MSSTLKCTKVSRQGRKNKSPTSQITPTTILFTDLLLDVFSRSEDSNTLLEAVKQLASPQNCTIFNFYCDPITRRLFKPSTTTTDELIIEDSTLSLKKTYPKNSCIVLFNCFHKILEQNENVNCIIMIVNWLNEFPITETLSFSTCLLFKNKHQKQCENILKYENFIAFYKSKDVQLLTINDLINLDENYNLDSNIVYVFVLQNTTINYRLFKIFYYSIIFKWMKWGIRLIETTKQQGDNDGLFKILNQQFHNELDTLVKVDIRGDVDSLDSSNIQFTSDLQSVFKCCPVVFDPENNVFKSCDVRFLISTAKQLAKTVSDNGILPDKYYNVEDNKPTLVIGGKMWKPSMMTISCLRSVGLNLFFVKRYAPNFSSGIYLNNYYTDLLDINEDTFF
jgi:hypothetical protein